MGKRRERLTGESAVTVECPPETRQRFNAQVGRLRDFSSLLERGASHLRFFPALVSDVFAFFYAPDATLRPEDHGREDRLHRLIVRFLFESYEYQRIRRRTAFDWSQALLATEEFATRLVTCLEADVPSSGGAAAERDGSVEIDGIVFASKAASGNGVRADRALLVFASEIERTLDGASVLTNLARSWGREEGALRSLPYEERARLARRLKDAPKLRQLAELAGRYRQLAITKQEAKSMEVPYQVVEVTRGADLSRLLADEMVSLCHPDLRYLFLVRLAEATLHQQDVRGREPAGRGSIVLCLDTSGSMAGEPEVIAKAIGLGLLEIARSQRRRFVGILFGSASEWMAFVFAGGAVEIRAPGQRVEAVAPMEGILRLATGFFGGGTDYETPLRLAMQAIEDDGVGVRDGDVVFVTDDYCEVSDGFLREYAAVKAARRFSTYSVIVGARASDARTLTRFSDRVISSFELTEEVAGQVFAAV